LCGNLNRKDEILNRKDAKRNRNERKGIQLTKTEFKISKLLLVTFAQDFAKLAEILTARAQGETA
jgi:hypothetical protein